MSTSEKRGTSFVDVYAHGGLAASAVARAGPRSLPYEPMRIATFRAGRRHRRAKALEGRAARSAAAGNGASPGS